MQSFALIEFPDGVLGAFSAAEALVLRCHLFFVIFLFFVKKHFTAPHESVTPKLLCLFDRTTIYRLASTFFFYLKKLKAHSDHGASYSSSAKVLKNRMHHIKSKW